MIVDITIFCRLFVFRFLQSRRCKRPGSRSSCNRFISDTDVVRLYDPCNSLRSALDVGFCRCGDRFCARCVSLC